MCSKAFLDENLESTISLGGCEVLLRIEAACGLEIFEHDLRQSWDCRFYKSLFYVVFSAWDFWQRMNYLKLVGRETNFVVHNKEEGSA